MNTTYDGTTPLQAALAELLGLNLKNQGGLADAVKEAYAIGGVVPVMGKKNPDKPAIQQPPNVRVEIWNYHKNKLASNYEQTDFVKLVESVDTSLDTSITEQVETTADDHAAIIEASPIEPIAVIPEHDIIESSTDSNNAVETMAIDNEPYSDNAVDNETVIDDAIYSDNAVIKVAFRTNTYGENKRQCVTLEGDTVNLLMLATGINKQGVSKWVQNAVNEWTDFDDKLPITRQVRRLINRAIETQLIKARG